MALTYKDAGVDIDAGDALVDRIIPHAKATRTPFVLDDVGGFAGLCGLPKGMVEPVLVAGTDGVGTKLKLAFDLGRHDTVGIDLVAMCVNDVITTGALPLFFLDYFATSKLDVEQGEAVIRGIAEGCKLAGCALLGGETAELPGFYATGEYDLAGFAVGVVDRPSIIDGKRVQVGDKVIGLASSGLHSNGYSLARAALFERGKRTATEQFRPSETEPVRTLGDALLEPTRIYVRAVRAALAAGDIRSMCHITGGGMEGNLPRVLPEGVALRIDERSWKRPAIFDLLQSAAEISEEEMKRTFNLGVGFVLVTSPKDVTGVIAALENAGERAWTLGEVIARPSNDAPQVVFHG